MTSLSEPIIHDIFEPNTGTWQYIVADPATKEAVIIDSVLDFDPATNRLTTTAADGLLRVVRDRGYSVGRILETHVHADHVTASRYLQRALEASSQGSNKQQQQKQRPAICIGKRVRGVQDTFAARYGIAGSEYAEAFDRLFDDDEVFRIGELEARAIHLPGHTPDHLGYMIGANVFCGDSLFNADVGSARCDFPGGDARALFASAQRLLHLPPDTKVWTGHDYPPGAGGRAEPRPYTTVAEQRQQNKHLKEGTTEGDFVAWRTARDAALAEPRLIHQSLQVNIRGGRLPARTAAGDALLHVPLKVGFSL